MAKRQLRPHLAWEVFVPKCHLDNTSSEQVFGLGNDTECPNVPFGDPLLLCLHMARYRRDFSLLALAKCWKAGAHQHWVHAGWPEGEGSGNRISKMGSWNHT